MSDIKITMMDLESMTPYDNNPRSNESSVEFVANSIRDFGFKVPIIVDKDGVIVAGHTRYLAAKSLGLDKVPTIIADDLTPEQVKAFRIADNKTAEQSDWNLLKLSKEIIDLDFDLGDFGFSDIEIENLESLGNDFFGTPKIPDEVDYSPNVYTPNLAPSESKAIVDDDQVEKAKIKQEQKFLSQSVSTHRTIICPHCYKEFEID